MGLPEDWASVCQVVRCVRIPCSHILCQTSSGPLLHSLFYEWWLPATHLPCTLLPITFILTQVKLSGSGLCFNTHSWCLFQHHGIEHHAVANASDIPGSLGQVKGEVFYAGKSLHPRADLDVVSSTEEECGRLLSSSSEEPSFPCARSQALVIVLASASLPSCIPLLLTL